MLKEASIQRLTQFENESPSVLDFLMFYIRMIKQRVQASVNCLEVTSDFLLDVQTIAYDLCKSIIIDASMLKYRPSVLAAVTVFLGFQLNFDLGRTKKVWELKSAEGRGKVGQVALAFQIWVDLLETTLELEDVPKVLQFCDHVFARMLQLFAEYKGQFANIYKERCFEYFVAAPPRTEPCSKTQNSPVRSHQQLPKYASRQGLEPAKSNAMLIDDSYCPTQKLNYETSECRSESLISSTDHNIDVEMKEDNTEQKRDVEMYDAGHDAWQKFVQASPYADPCKPEPHRFF